MDCFLITLQLSEGTLMSTLEPEAGGSALIGGQMDWRNVFYEEGFHLDA